jgi:UDP-N-acetylglucosamine transferase subunit ALG13
MIFVTVGSTRFDKLIEAVDRAKENGLLTEDVICQIGNGDYIPKHCDHFKFRPSIDDLLASASLVITHGGTTALSLLASRRPFVAIANTALSGDHQTHFLRAVAGLAKIPWSNEPADLPILLEQVKKTDFKAVKIPSLADSLVEFIDQSSDLRR